MGKRKCQCGHLLLFYTSPPPFLHTNCRGLKYFIVIDTTTQPPPPPVPPKTYRTLTPSSTMRSGTVRQALAATVFINDTSTIPAPSQPSPRPVPGSGSFSLLIAAVAKEVIN